MKKYFVVAWECYYPDAGLQNIRGVFDSKEEAEEFKLFITRDRSYDNCMIVDSDHINNINQYSYDYEQFMNYKKI